jgi:predicted nucleic acid-binding protein
MYLVTHGLYRARWTEKIHAEWIGHVKNDYPSITKEYIHESRRLMNLHAAGSLVTGYEDIIPSLSLPDEKDRHVLAAAIFSKAPLIVTFNLIDFPAIILEQYAIEAVHPDSFLSALYDLSPSMFMAAFKHHHSQMKNPPLELSDFIKRFSNCGTPQIAHTIQRALSIGVS